MGASILVLGAGRSSSALIGYLKEHAQKFNASLTVADLSFHSVENFPWGAVMPFDIRDDASRRSAIQSADVVISMIPASLHPVVARECLEAKKHLLTASYVSDEMKMLNDRAKAADLLFLNECGLDPGIDHMSAMQVIDRITAEGGRMLSFESFTGGLIAPETAPDNPWRYKFTWNPRNVVVAGQGTSRFLHHGKNKFIPYQQLFRRVTAVSIPGSGDYEGYANRDSLKYIEAYGLQSVKTMLRGTLRFKGFCSAWDVLVQIGCTEDTYQMPSVEQMTHLDFVTSFLELAPNESAAENISRQFGVDPNGPELERLRWSGFFESEPVGLAKGTPAQILEHILNKKWKLEDADKDLVVMWHRFVYESEGMRQEIQSSLVTKGEDRTNTAMARTVGLPLAIAARLLLEGKIHSRGVVIPTIKEIYEPVLSELKSLGIALIESKRDLP